MKPSDSRSALQHRRPLWLGVVVAPWAAPIALAVFSYVSDRASGGRHSATAAIEVLIFALALGLPMAYAGTIGLGLPLVLWLRRRGRLAAVPLLLAAPIAGSLALVLGFAFAGFKLGLAAQLGIGAVTGVAVAAVFCLLCGIPWWARSDR